MGGALKKIRDFRPAKDDASANELRRQLGQFEENVSSMGADLSQSSLQRLTKNADPKNPVAPGQFRIVDTRTGAISVLLAKPKAKDEGTFIVIVDLGGGAGSIYVQAQNSTYDAVGSAFLTVTTFAALIFCDGTNYWRAS